MESPNVSSKLYANTEESPMDGMSPMTDLTRNLSSLSTTLLSPCRRLSWSNPRSNPRKPCQTTVTDSPFTVDSPSIQEGVLRGLEPNVRHRKSERCRTFSKLAIKKLYAQDKENQLDLPVTSLSFNTNSKQVVKPSESDISGLSQESGYGEADEKFMDFSLSHGSVQSSLFTDEEQDDDEAFFAVEDVTNDDNISLGMTQLLKNPLRESTDSPIVETSNKPRPVIKRSLSLFASDSPVYSCSNKMSSVSVKIALKENNNAENTNNAKTAFKRPEPVDELTPVQSKRRKSSPNVAVPLPQKTFLHRCYSETATTIMNAIQKSDQHPDFIGDFSRPFSLPLIVGRHQDLKTIKSETLARLIKGEFADIKRFSVIDCRYPYEYEGGHIMGARNIYTKEDLFKALLVGVELPENECEQQGLTIFHCEFSSERAPKLLRFLRNKDRELNEGSYPRLHHPEVYLLEGGYKAFYEDFKQFCQPQSYKPMVHKDHTRELCEFRAKSKSFGNDSKLRPRLRSNLKF